MPVPSTTLPMSKASKSTKPRIDRKSTRLNSSHLVISYAVFCLKKKNTDSVDMLGDAIVYGFSLYVLRRETAWKARGALLKGGVMPACGLCLVAGVVVEFARGLG